jgi:hypothetical protein
LSDSRFKQFLPKTPFYSEIRIPKSFLPPLFSPSAWVGMGAATKKGQLKAVPFYNQTIQNYDKELLTLTVFFPMWKALTALSTNFPYYCSKIRREKTLVKKIYDFFTKNC